MSLEESYQAAIETETDIHEHVATLSRYAQKCRSVLELGTGQRATASWGFLHGLVHGRLSGLDGPRRMVGVDIAYVANSERVAAVAKQHDVEYSFFTGSDLELPIREKYPDGFDLLFIDTWHCFGQLRRELAMYAPVAHRYIVMHDTEVDGVYGEDIRLGGDIVANASRVGFPVREAAIGLLPAIREFLQMHPEWTVAEHLTNNNGLTILEKNTLVE